jgi:hypothetical protein
MLQSIVRKFRPSSQPGRAGKRPQCRRNFESLERRELFSVSTPEGNWAAAGGGMQDASTGLVWGGNLRSDVSSGYSYSEASLTVDNLVLGGYDDWRLPTKAELLEAFSHNTGNYFENWWSSAWTSDKGIGKGTHWAVSLSQGSAAIYGDGFSFGLVPVRGTRAPAPSQPNVRVFTENMTLTENQLARFSVVLDKRPTANVTIAVSSTDPTEGTSSVSSFVFTKNNWNVPQLAHVNAILDGIVDGDIAFQIVLANAVSTDPNYNGRAVADIDVTVRDNVVTELVSDGLSSLSLDDARFGTGDSSELTERARSAFGERPASPLATQPHAADYVFDALFGSLETPAPNRARRLATTR